MQFVSPSAAAPFSGRETSSFVSVSAFCNMVIRTAPRLPGDYWLRSSPDEMPCIIPCERRCSSEAPFGPSFYLFLERLMASAALFALFPPHQIPEEWREDEKSYNF